MPRIVLLIYHGTGHFNACLRLGRILQQDFEVVFAGFEYFTSYVEAQGFLYYPLKTIPFGIGFETWLNKNQKKKNVFWHSLKDRWRDKLYRLRQAELAQLILDTRPDYLLLDAWKCTDFIPLYNLLKHHQIRFAFIQTMLPTSIHPAWPPLNSLALPGQTNEIAKARQRLIRSELKKNFIDWIQSLGKSNASVIRNKLKSEKIPTKYMTAASLTFTPAIDHIAEFVLAPYEFNFSKYPITSHQHYLGFMPDAKRIETADADYLRHHHEIVAKLGQNTRLVYCSFGSVHPTDSECVAKFVTHLTGVLQKMKIIGIITVNNINIPQTAAHDHVYFFRAVPQLEILAKAKVFITHGGLNSISEAIQANVPMLVYPLNADTDQPGNSSRVAYHGIGLRGDLRTDSSEDIQDKITELIQNPSYRENLNKLKLANEQYDPNMILNLLRDLKPLDDHKSITEAN